MKSKNVKVLAFSTAAVVAATAGMAIAAGSDDDYSATLAGKIDSSKPKNVILLIGDGMGDSEVTSARYYGKGAAGRLNMDKLPFRGSSIHYVLSPGPGPNYAPNYAGDSAPTAVAWSTGKRTIDGRLAQGPSVSGTTPGSNAGYKTYMEIAREKGKATGNVSTAEITDATPAGPSAHISQRGCQGPADTRASCPTEAKTAGGLGSVAEQTIDTGYDVILGGGRARWTQPLATTGTDTVLTYATSKGYTQQIGDEAGLNGITSLAGGKVLGLFNNSNMTTDFKPLYARTDAYLAAQATAGTLDPKVNGGSATTRCEDQRESTTNEPSLAQLTKKSIDLLKTDPEGFTLQVEGASIDKRDHAADVCGQIGEMLAFDEAIGVAQEFQQDNPDTLVVVSADHSHTSQIINANSKPAPGASYATVQTVDGAPMRIAYGTGDTGNGPTTNGAPSQAHTGATVPVWASGPQAANVQGTIDQTDIFSILNGKTPSTIAAAGGKDGVDGVNGLNGTPGAPGPKGADGSNGAPGTDGVAGPAGAAGPAGVAGPAGAAGAAGSNGAPGAAGAPGATGATGPAGRDAQVTCKSSGSRTVKCTVSFGSSSKASKARLVRKGKTVATGTVSKKGALTLKAKSNLAKGSYTLVARGQSVQLKLG